MTKQPFITVAVCTYARAAYLRRTLETLVCQETPGFTYEILVVDDASPGDTREAVEEAAAQAPVPVRYVRQEGRKGLVHVRNRAVDEAQGDWLVFFDDDQLAAPDWLAQLLHSALEHNAQVVGGPRRLHLPEATMARLGPECRALLGENIYGTPPEVLDGKHLPSTGNLLLDMALFDEMGHFDPAFTGSEDSEFLQRVRSAGHEIWTAPGAMCSHLIPQYRIEPAYFRWASLRWGNGFAKINAKQHGRLWMTGLCLARIGQAVLLTTPRWWWALLRGDRARALDTKLLLWRAQGYVRTALWLIAPRLFPQRQFLEYMDFGQERHLFPKQDPAL